MTDTMAAFDFSWPDAVLALFTLLLGMLLGGVLLRGKARALQNANTQLGRELTRSQTSVEHLQERLDDARDSVYAKEEELRHQVRRVQELEKQHIQLQTTHDERVAHFQQMQASVEQSRKQLTLEFQNLADRILEEKGKAFAASSHSSLEAMLRPFREQVEGFQKRVNQIHDEALRGNVSLSAEIKRVADMGMQIGTEANSLATALRGEKKTTGNWGEIQLERTLQLAGLMKGDHYEAQPQYKDRQDQRRQPDFVVHLPDNKHLIIDSKVSLVDYDRAVSAENPPERTAALDAHVQAIRVHIDDLSAKDYSNLIGMRSPSFVLMYLPIEAAYIEALKHSNDVFEYAWRKNVILVSHTTLLPVLKTVANVWMIMRSNEQAHQLGEYAGDIYNQVALMAERLKRLGATLSTASRHYNDTVTAVAGQQGLFGKVSRFAELSARANKSLPSIDPLNSDFHEERLTWGITKEPDVCQEKLPSQPESGFARQKDGSAG